MDRLRITEIFFSLQGETRTVGIPTIFIRLTGCPLRCHYCDTAYAFHGGKWHTFTEIFDEVKKYHCKYITVTGGEPLAQKKCFSLLTSLCDAGYEVSLETSGAINVAQVDDRVVKVLDIKTPASGEVEKNKWKNLRYLTPKDQIKFVICNEEDYLWAKNFIQEQHLHTKCEILLSPSHEALNPTTLANWILTDHLPVRLQIQLHKHLWGNTPGR